MTLLLSILLFAAGVDSLGIAEGSSSGALFSHRKALTSVEAGWMGRSESNPLIPEEGSSAGQAVINIRTLVRPDSVSVVRGGVRYENGIKNNVRWNSSSDYGIVFPYVMADSLSGNVRKETYAFFGEYAFRRGAWNFGFRGSYRALHEWREVDPRPRNIVSDLSVNFSSGRALSAAYVLDLCAGYRRYSQSNTLTFFNPRGANTSEFHLTGLGSAFERFTGAISSHLTTRYAGNGLSLALTLYPLQEKGWKASFQYDLLDNVHYLPNLNEVPYTELITHNIQLAGDYTDGPWTIGGKLHAQYRKGIESVLDNGKAGAYNILMRFHMYSGFFYKAQAHASYRMGRWTFNSLAAYRGFVQKYAYPAREFSVSGLDACVGARYNMPAGKWLLQAEAQAVGFVSLSGNMSIPSDYTIEALQDYHRSRLYRLTTSTVGGMAGFRAERPVMKTVRAFAGARACYDSVNSIMFIMLIGLNF